MPEHISGQSGRTLVGSPHLTDGEKPSRDDMETETT
jgi:hypothetical protein